MLFNKLCDQNVAGKTVLIRADFNVPLHNGQISDDTRIRASLASIEYCLNEGAAVIVMTHLGRPKEGQPTPDDSIAPIAARLGELLGVAVDVLEDWQTSYLHRAPKTLAMLPNVRLNVGEKANSAELGQAYARLCDIYVNDAFGTAHRAEASTEAVAHAAPVSCAGFLMCAELEALERALSNPKRPVVAIVGGSKVSSKLGVLETLADKVDSLIVGGGIANTFLLAEGVNIGQSLAEPALVEQSLRIKQKLAAKNATLPLPIDVVCAKTFALNATPTVKLLRDIAEDDMILDVGPLSVQALMPIIQNAAVVIWNGPLGVFEFPAFSEGTKSLARAIAKSDAFSIAGGGDTLAAVAAFDVSSEISYISTGGGAFLEFVQGDRLPAMAVLESRAGRGA